MECSLDQGPVRDRNLDYSMTAHVVILTEEIPEASHTCTLPKKINTLKSKQTFVSSEKLPVSERDSKYVCIPSFKRLSSLYLI